MIKDEEVKQIIDKRQLSDIEELQVIRRYIYDKKGVDVGEIQRPNGTLCLSTFPPTVDIDLLVRCYNNAFAYYINKFKDGN